MKKIVVRLGKRSYPILIGQGIMDQAGQRLRAMGLKGRAFVVTNKNVMRFFARQISRSFMRGGIEPHFETVPDSEKSKSAGAYIRVLENITKRDVLKGSFIVALGGGVVGDLAGFIAATYKRGVPFIQIPTTLLAQVDSAIGGKTGIDLRCAKNMAGAFYQPRAVLSDIDALVSLPKPTLVSGLAEVIKYGVIKDAVLFRFLEYNIEAILSRDREALEYIVYRSSAIKAAVVEQDEFDAKGLRAVLNYGHTVGHAIEAAAAYSKRYNHGEAVAVGMAAAAYIAKQMDILSENDFNRICGLIERAGLSVKAAGVSASAIYNALLHDKKFVRGVPRLVIPVTLGKVRLIEGIKPSIIKTAVAKAVSGRYD